MTMVPEFDPSVPPHTYFTPTIEAGYRAQIYWTLAALSFLVWEHLGTFPREIVYIWRRPATKVKFIYVFSRYFGLLFQLVNYLVLMNTVSRIPVPPSKCLAWYIFQTISFLLLFSAMEIILMLRVYALYGHSKMIGITLTTLFVSEVTLMTIMSIRTLSILQLQFDVICNALVTPKEALVFGSCVMLVQLIIGVLTVAKSNTGQSRGINARIAKLVLRDGIWAFSVVSAILSLVIPYSFVKQLARPFIVYAWPNCLFSVTTCRLIINFQQLECGNADYRLSLRNIAQTPSDIELPPILVASNVALDDLNMY